jgi:putative ABC transport system permease protein
VRTFDELDARFRAIPGVTSVGYISGLPLGPGENIRSFRRPELPPPAPGQDPFALYRIVDPDYFRTLGIPIVAGRPFDGTDRDGTQRVIIVSRRFAEAYFPQEEAIGKIIRFGRDDSRMIVGIVENVHSQTLEQVSQPEMYMPHAQVGQRNTTFVIRSEVPASQILSALRPIIQERDRNLPLIRPGTLEDTVNRQVARPRFYLLLLALFATLAVSLASIGTFGVVAYAVEQRRKEIGVRIALGARPAQVLLVMLWEGLKPAVVGIVLGLAGAFAASRFMNRLLFRIPATDPWTFASVTLLLIGLVALASIVPAARAMRVPAATALRTE